MLSALRWLRVLWPAFVTAAPLLWLMECQGRRHAYDLGRREAEVRVIRNSLDTWRYVVDSLNKQAAKQRETLTVSVTRWREGKARLDTAWLRDTVPVPVEVVREVAAQADTAIRACLLTVDTCERRVAARDSIIAQQTRLIRALPKPEARWRGWVRQGVAFGLGVAVGRSVR